MDVDTLRREFTTFTYQKYSWTIKNNDLLAEWTMGNNKFTFHPSLVIHNIPKLPTFIEKSAIGNLVFHLGLCEIMTYWKAFCSPLIEIKAGYLDDNQIMFWQKLLIKGMGQYFFENSIDFTPVDFIKFKCNFNIKKENSVHTPLSDHLLLLLGGGKDSAVALELISQNYKTDHINTMALNQKSYPAIEKINEASGNPFMIKVERNIDSQLYGLNSSGFLNGHTPFSSYLAFLSVFVAILTGAAEIILSNEQSSNEQNTEYLGQKINHQYSKSFEFEKDFREYCSSYLSKVNYFSLLRPYYELQILKMFSKMEKYHPLFISCNKGKDKWCGSCSKCASTFLGLYPFMEMNKILAIFGRDLFCDKKMVEIYRSMVDSQAVKPFECVGTLEETRIALYLSYIKKETDKKSPVMQFFKENVEPLYDNWEEKTKLVLDSYNKDNFLSGPFMVLLKNAYAILR